MAVNKNFVVKNGLEVSTNLILADATTKKVGIGSTIPSRQLDVSGGIGATDINVSGAGTITTFEATTGTITTLESTTSTITDATATREFVTDLNVTGVGTIGVGVVTNLTGTNVKFSGISTLGVLEVSATGIVTASSGIVTYYGDGQFLQNVISGVGVRTEGSIIGYGATFLDFRGAGVSTITFGASSGITTINITGGGGDASIGIGTTPGDAFSGIVTAGNLWYNSNLGRLFIYYQDANSAQWVDAAPFNVGVITSLQSVTFEQGSAGSPSITFDGDTDTGFFQPTANHVSAASAGVGILTVGQSGLNVTGVVTATSFSGDGGGLTGVASTDNITTSTRVRFLDNLSVSGVSTLGSAVTVGGSGVHVTGVVTATSFVGDGSNLTALNGTAIASGTVAAARVATLNQNTTGTAGGLSGTPDIAINNITGVAATFTGNVTIGGTISYEDVTNVDSLGIITARSGIQVSGIVTARAGFAVTYYGDGSNLTGVVSGIGLSEGGTAKGSSITDVNFVGATVTATGAGATITISAGIGTNAQTGSTQTVTLDLSNAQDHKVTVTGITTIDCAGGTEGDSHTVRIINSGIATVGFSTYFLFPSGATPTLPEADGGRSLISFTINRVGGAGTELFAGASVNYS
jgi:hypothetical protein